MPTVPNKDTLSKIALGRLKRLESYFSSDDLALIRRIIRDNAGRHWRGYAIGFVMTAIVAASTSFVAYLIGSIVNATYMDRSFPAVATLSATLVAIFTIRGLAAYGNAVAIARVGNRVIAETQQRIVDKMLKQDVRFFADRHSSEFMANAVIGAHGIGSILNQLVLALGRDLLMVIGLIGLMFWQDPILSLLTLTVLPLALVGVQKLVVRARSIADTQFSGSAAMLSTVQETVQGLRIIKAFTLEDMVRSRVADNIKSLEKASNKLARITNRSAPLIEALGGIAIGIACLYAGFRVLSTNAAPGQLVSFLTAFLLAFEPARRLGRIKLDLSAPLAAATAIYRILDTTATEEDDTSKTEFRSSGGRIELTDVEFAYRADTPVLRGLSLSAEPGQLTALVGPSGSGKTTVLNLLMHFYDVNGGRVVIDGQNVRDVSRTSLRSNIAYVSQDIFLFRSTIRESILIGKLDATEAEIIAAAKAAYAHDFIMAFPAGYDTPVGEGGSQLSLGQRQRIAVARAFLRNAPIVLLDEPTASLDSESEHQVQAAIRRLCAGKTTLAIAHRLNTILDAHAIHVIENGRVVECGRHEELLASNGRYATLFQLQFGKQSEGARGIVKEAVEST